MTEAKEYSRIYRGLCFIEVIWFSSSPIPSVFLCVASRAYWRERGGKGVGKGAKSYDGEKDWSSLNTLWLGLTGNGRMGEGEMGWSKFKWQWKNVVHGSKFLKLRQNLKTMPHFKNKYSFMYSPSVQKLPARQWEGRKQHWQPWCQFEEGTWGEKILCHWIPWT